MSSRFPRAYRQQLAATDEANIQRAVGQHYTIHENGAIEHYGRTYHDAVDSRRLRGIPAIGPGVTGATPDTRPGWNL